MSVSVVRVEELLTSLHLPHEVKRHAPIMSVQEALESGVLTELGITAGSIVKNVLLNDIAGACYLLVAPGMGRTDLKAMAQRIGSTRLSFASRTTFSSVFGPAKGPVTLFDLLDDDDRTRNVHLVLDSRVSEIAGNTAFHIGTNTVSVLVRAADTPTIASAIQPSYMTI